MKAINISIGDELLIGQTVNTNSSFIGSALTDIGIDLIKISVIQDNYNSIIEELKEAWKSFDLIVITGGLGPTHDDMTRKCIVDFFETDLITDENVLIDITNFFKQRGREVTPTNRDQALVPRISKPIRNSKGTAPGIWIEKDNKILVAMPGVPYEMKEMMNSSIVPSLKELISRNTEFRGKLLLMTTGIPESILYERFGDLDALLGGAQMAFLPNEYGVKLRINTKGNNEEEVSNKLSEIEQKIRNIAGRFIYGKNDENLEETVARLLKERRMRVAVAESCTGGLVSSRLTNVPGSSSFFDRGVVTYSNAAKVELLKVNEDVIEKYGAVSVEVALQMAEGVKAISGSDIGIAITGIMGPGGETINKPIGLVYIGICDEKLVTVKEFRFGNDRIINKSRTSQAALELLRRNLLGIPYDE